MANVISLDDVYTALSSSKPSLYKAIVSLILSSSMNASVLSKLTLYDFLYACDDYFVEGEEKTFDNLLKKDPWDIIPCWKLKSDGRITFSTPESTFYLFLYLKDKRLIDLDNLNNPLFKRGENNFLTSSKISSYVTEFNKVLGTENNYFKSKNLINTFDYICNAHFYFEDEYKNNLMDLFEGKLSNKSKLFRESLKNSNGIKKDYESIIPYLTARNCNFEKFLEHYLALRNSNINKKDVILSYYKNNIEEKLQLSYGQSRLLCKFAQDLAIDDSLLTNDFYLNKVFKKAIVKLISFNHDFTYLELEFYDIFPEIKLNDRVRSFETIISRLNIDEYFEINKGEIHRICIDYLVDNNLYDNDITVSDMPNIAEKIIFELIDEETEDTPIKSKKDAVDFDILFDT